MAQDDEKQRSRKNGSRKIRRRSKGAASILVSNVLPLLALVLGLGLITFTLIPSVRYRGELPTEVGQIARTDVKSGYEFTVIDAEATRQRRESAVKSVQPVFDDNVDAVDAGIRALTGMFDDFRKRLWYAPHLYLPTGDSMELARDYLDLLELGLPAPPPVEPPAPADSEAGGEENAPSPTSLPTAPPQTYEWTSEGGQVQTMVLRSGAAMPIDDEAGFWERERLRVIDNYGLKIPPEHFMKLATAAYDQRLKTSVLALLKRLQIQRGIVRSIDTLRQLEGGTLVRRNLRTGEETTVSNIESILSFSQATERLSAQIHEMVPNDPELEAALFATASLVLTPNLSLAVEETNRRRQVAAEEIEPVGYLVKENEMIVREGDPVTPTQLLKINKMRSLRGERNFGITFVGMSLLLFLLFDLSYRFYIHRFRPSLGQWQDSALLLLSVVVVVLVICRLLFAAVEGVAANYSSAPWNSLSSYSYILPFCTGPMLVALIVGAELGLIFAIVFSLLSGLMLGGSLNFAIFNFVASLAGIYGVTTFRQRSGIWKAGLLVSLTSMAMVVPLDVISGSIFSSTAPLDLLCALAHGLLTAFLISGLIPVYEFCFGVTTDFKLLELSNLDHPLLREMIVQAPGTYQHSFIVGILAETAAKDIGANSLLTKVGSYFHDIGKMKNPTFFIENMIGMRNKHDKIQPSLSALIIISHVREGVEIARKFKLGRPIRDIIQQHHGTTLVSFFYNKAKAMEDADVCEVRESDYRYDGPKPQSKEAAIVMIADSCEAASRTIKSPTYPKVRDMVMKIIQSKAGDGQFDECDLTFRDLHTIQKSIEKALMAQFHGRIDYPGFNFDERPPATALKPRPVRT